MYDTIFFLSLFLALSFFSFSYPFYHFTSIWKFGMNYRDRINDKKIMWGKKISMYSIDIWLLSFAKMIDCVSSKLLPRLILNVHVHSQALLVIKEYNTEKKIYTKRWESEICTMAFNAQFECNQ